MTQNDDDAWFAPKSYGYGSGLPIRREGWVVLIGYIILIAAAGWLIPFSLLAFGLIAAAATAALILICAQKTRGGMRWRWGEKD